MYRLLEKRYVPVHSEHSARRIFEPALHSSHIVHLTTRRTVEMESADLELPALPPVLADLVDIQDPDLDYIVAAVEELRAAGLNVSDPAVFQVAVALGHKRARTAPDDTSLQPATEARIAMSARVTAIHAYLREREPEPVVYYMRTGLLCKIGITRNVAQRVVTLGAEEILAVEPGGRKLERFRHKQFAGLRSTREWFHYEGELIEHVHRLQRNFADEALPNVV